VKRAVFFVLASLGVLACSSGGSSAGTGGATTATSSSKSSTGTTTTGTGGGATMCVAKGAPGNSLGVGKYCTPGGGQCSGLPAGLCTADIGQSDWFCVKVGCQTNSDCGADAQCVMQTGGAGCVPDSCLGGTGGSSGTGGSPSDAGDAG
jgi:hypothetical protein